MNSAGSAGPVRENRAACAGYWSRGAWWEVKSLRRRPHARGAEGGGLADYNSQRALRRRGALPPLRGPLAGRAIPARPGQHGGIAPPVLEERSEGFVSAIEFLAARTEQQGPPAAGGLHGAGGHASAWPGFRDRHRPLQRPGGRPEHKAVLLSGVPLKPPRNVFSLRKDLQL